MLGINYFKAEPAEYARISVNGKIRKEGEGISGFYLGHNTSIEMIGVTTIDQPFVFKEISNDNQELTIQGGFLYQVEDPTKVLKRYNLAIDPKSGTYLSEDNTKIPEHIVQLIRANARRAVQKNSLEALLVMNDELSKSVGDELSKANLVDELGINVKMLYFESIKPAPEIEKALGTEYREGLLQKADVAIYERRAMAVEQERAIKENELSNLIGLEEKRTQLVRLQGDNTIAEAKYKTEAEKLSMTVFDGLNPETLRAHALYQIGKNAARIETLTITPEVLAGLK